MIQFIKYLLFPISLIYKSITSLRNLLFDIGVLPTFEPPIASIGVGNLTVGGTGKTPMVDYLISILPNKNIGVISRGYSRKTKGFIQLGPKSTSKDVGDEPLMLYSKNSRNSFFVSENRVEGFNKAMMCEPELNVVLFDDVFQHRYLKPKVNILLCDYSRPFYNDFLLPTGLLRESKKNAKRADIIIVTKCPENIPNIEREAVLNKIRKYSGKTTRIYFAFFQSLPPINIENTILKSNSKVVLVSGLANNLGFRKGIEENFEILKHFEFKDHHDFSQHEIEQILKQYPDTKFVCTEKDFVKIKQLIDSALLPFFYISSQKVRIFNEIDLKKDIFDRLGFIY